MGFKDDVLEDDGIDPNRDKLEAEIVRVIAGETQDAIAGERQSAKAGNAFRIARALIAAFPVLGSSDREDPNG